MRRDRFYSPAKCWCCGESFQASRVDAKFCGPRCRKTWSRLLKKVGAAKRLPLPLEVV